MKRFTAFAIAFLFLILLTVPCFAEEGPDPTPRKDPTPPLHQPVTL